MSSSAASVQMSSWPGANRNREPGGRPRKVPSSGTSSIKCSACSGTKKSGASESSPVHTYQPDVSPVGGCRRPCTGQLQFDSSRLLETPTTEPGSGVLIWEGSHTHPHMPHVVRSVVSMSGKWSGAGTREADCDRAHRGGPQREGCRSAPSQSDDGCVGPTCRRKRRSPSGRSRRLLRGFLRLDRRGSACLARGELTDPRRSLRPGGCLARVVDCQ